MGKLNVLKIMLIVFCAGLFSCTEADMDIAVKQGNLMVHPRWSAQGVYPCTYVMFNCDTEAFVYHSECASQENEEHVTQTLPEGKYRVMAYNNNVDGLEYVFTNNYHQAMVRSLPKTEARAATTRLAEPSAVYVALSDEVVVVDKENITTRPGLISRTKTLRFTFTLTGINNVARISGALPGVYPSVLLASGQITAEEKKRCPEVAIPFNASVENGKGQVVIRLFGILDPADSDSPYSNTLPLTLSDTDGNQITTVIVDMNETITNMLKANEGTLPPEESGKEVNIDIQVKPIFGEGNLTATVKSWYTGIQAEGTGSI